MDGCADQMAAAFSIEIIHNDCIRIVTKHKALTNSRHRQRPRRMLDGNFIMEMLCQTSLDFKLTAKNVISKRGMALGSWTRTIHLYKTKALAAMI